MPVATALSRLRNAQHSLLRIVTTRRYERPKMTDDAGSSRARVRLRVFISSPSDVEAERGITRAVLRRLAHEPQFEGRIDLDEVSYDDPDDPASMDAHLTFQSAINLSKPRPSACDVVVVI